MTKGKSHSNREVKKPKKVKTAVSVKTSDLFSKGTQEGLGAKKKP